MDNDELNFILNAFINAIKASKVSDTQYKLMTYEYVHHLAKDKIVSTDQMVALVKYILNEIARNVPNGRFI